MMKSVILKPLINRVLTSLLVLFLLITFVFVLIRLAPGDPSQKFLSPKLSPELSAQVQKSFGLDKPIYIQYFAFVSKILTGDFGVSYNYRQPVLSVIKDYFLFTLIFASISLAIQLFIALLLAKASFKNQGKVIDKFLSGLSVIIYSIPSFVVALVLIYIFAVKLNLLPTSGIGTIYSDENNFLENVKDRITHLLLPLITLSIAGIVVFYKYLRDNLVSTSNQTFITNLRASGYSEKIIYSKHLLPNAIQPLISIVGIEFGLLLGGALITEVIFALPGMGRLTLQAILNRDFPLVIGCTLIAGIMIIVTNLVADLIKIKTDKRLVKELIK
ncbi:MAG: ABC transporter permease [Ignavibacteriales bacterium]|nr:ABC transporter permease [Ignavibacteriales bacterium]